MVQFEAEIRELSWLNYWFIELTPEILAQLPGRKEKGDFNQRLWITLDQKVSWQAGVLALGEGSGLITVQQIRLKQLEKTLGDTVQVILVKDESEYGTEVPEEIQEYWLQVPETKARFDQLSKSMQRYILNYISSVKTPVKRSERAHLLLSNLLKSIPGKENFRFLLGKE